MDDCTCSLACSPDPEQPWLSTRVTALLAPPSTPTDPTTWRRITCARFDSFTAKDFAAKDEEGAKLC